MRSFDEEFFQVILFEEFYLKRFCESRTLGHPRKGSSANVCSFRISCAAKQLTSKRAHRSTNAEPLTLPTFGRLTSRRFNQVKLRRRWFIFWNLMNQTSIVEQVKSHFNHLHSTPLDDRASSLKKIRLQKALSWNSSNFAITSNNWVASVSSIDDFRRAPPKIRQFSSRLRANRFLSLESSRDSRPAGKWSDLEYIRTEQFGRPHASQPMVAYAVEALRVKVFTLSCQHFAHQLI